MNDKETKSVFELSKIEYGHYDEENPLQYPSFEVSTSRLGLYSTLEKAVQGMKDYIEEQKKFDEEQGTHKRLESLFGFSIDELEFDKFSYLGNKSERNYLPDGSLWDESLVSSVVDKDYDFIEEFFGRPADRLRFHPGDLAEVLDGDTVTLEIVGYTPWSPEKVNEHRIFVKDKYGCDYRSDCLDDVYYTMSAGDETHSHPLPTMLFPVRLPVSDDVKNQLETRYKNFITNLKKYVTI
jgi:hypothetical protein